MALAKVALAVAGCFVALGQSQALPGYITFLRFTDGYDVTLSALELATGDISDVFLFGTQFESFFVECTTTRGDNATLYLSLEYVNPDTAGYAVVVDVPGGRLLAAHNSTYCYGLGVAAQSATDAYCITEGATASELHRVNMSSGHDTPVATLPAGYIPDNMAIAFSYSKQAFYVQLIEESASNAVLFTVDCGRGQVTNNASVPWNVIYYNLAWSEKRQKLYGITGDYQGGSGPTVNWTTALAVIDPQEGTHAVVGSDIDPFKAYSLNQFNAIVAIADALDTLFFTAFDNIGGGASILYLVGVSLDTGAATYVQRITNPFVDIEWFPAIPRLA